MCFKEVNLHLYLLYQLDIYGRLSKTMGKLKCAKEVEEGGSAGALAELPEQLDCAQTQMQFYHH